MATSGLTPQLLDFERSRLELFASRGFEGESRWVTDREGRSTYAIGRGRGGHPTVLIHGGLSQAGEWFALADRIPGPVVIPDRPGCGLSYAIDYRKVADFRPAATEWLLDLIETIEADQVQLVASSMGGFFAIAFTAAHPDRVRSLALVGAPLGLDMKVPLFLRLWGSPISGPIISRMKITDPEKLRKQVYPMLVAHPEDVPLDFLELDIAQSELPGAARSAYTGLRAIGTWRGVRPELRLDEELADIRTPTLFAWGASDGFAPPSVGQKLAARMADARVEILADTGHLPHIERPEAVAAAITEFLAEASSPGSTILD